MTALDAPPLLRIPPFPNAVLPQLSCRDPQYGVDLPDDEVDRIAVTLAKERVGGTYWASQPEMPDRPYTLVRMADPDNAARTISGLGNACPIVWWTGSTSGQAVGTMPDLSCVEGEVDPWHVLGGAAEVVVDSDDELALLAALAGVAVTCIGSGQFKPLESGGVPAIRDALRRYAVHGRRYADPFTGHAMQLTDLIALCGFWRKLIDSNRAITAAVGFAFWKRASVAPLLWGGTSHTPFASKPKSLAAGAQIAVWKSRTDRAALVALQSSDAQLIEVEDGFIRSSGLGADCVPPLSIIVDSVGIYFDPSRPSELEQLLQKGKQFGPDLLDRARRLRNLIVELGISKYGSGVSPLERGLSDIRYLLVPGQVEDDRSVICGGGAVSTNFELLRRVREANPEAYIIYKPHPDVEAGHRKGAIPEDICLGLADEIIRTSPISSLIDLVDEVHVNTSLAGFEALLRGKSVTTYGVPFYAGWGLSQDLGSIPQRRTARRTLDELVAATLLLYPRYLDPVTGLPCPPEVLIRRLSEGGAGRADGPLVWLRRLQGRANRTVSKLWSR